jgi:hypothetical protein
MYGDGALTALPYAMNTEFGRILANEMVNIFNYDMLELLPYIKYAFIICRNISANQRI